jgi:hypothetical protein
MCVVPDRSLSLSPGSGRHPTAATAPTPGQARPSQGSYRQQQTFVSLHLSYMSGHRMYPPTCLHSSHIVHVRLLAGTRGVRVRSGLESRRQGAGEQQRRQNHTRVGFRQQPVHRRPGGKARCPASSRHAGTRERRSIPALVAMRARRLSALLALMTASGDLYR